MDLSIESPPSAAAACLSARSSQRHRQAGRLIFHFPPHRSAVKNCDPPQIIIDKMSTFLQLAFPQLKIALNGEEEGEALVPGIHFF